MQCLALPPLSVVGACRVDGPVWVLRHNVTAANSLTPIPAPAPPATTEDSISATKAEQLAAATHRVVLTQRSYDWFLYDCPAEQMGGRVGRGCSERQEGAVSKSATFFASENTLPTEHGSPQVGVRLQQGVGGCVRSWGEELQQPYVWCVWQLSCSMCSEGV